ncbi:AbrB family transcriptional regulator [Chelatococcus reniformis]|uniref:Ammonia monooxygenase n=1 Tax=Chelatococcus reniformis TaxID=1494448 RepID=A0A916X7L9_9HYPH|nr:AbrB family transcriptional regulator [Chelatococcus reniformis]GGC46543.1 ammonia monooxygenase [Chelatococcus reniformis]
MRAWPRTLQWVALFLASGVFGVALHAAQLPAALLLGPLLGAICVAVCGAQLALPRPAFIAAQGIVGCLVARAITASILWSIAKDWPAMLLIVLTTVIASGLVGAALTRLGTLPGATAAWGSAPGAASAMVAMGEAFGADPRLVAFMQYLRVVCVVFTASLVSRLLLGAEPVALAPSHPHDVAPWTSQIGPVAVTLLIAWIGAFIGAKARIPAGGMLVPMVVGGALHIAELVPLTLPQPLLACAYAAIGWYIGLRFTPKVLLHAIRAMPQLLLATFALIALCGGSAVVLHLMLGTDPLTAFLATTPGGLDAVAIIAVGTHADVPLVLAAQTLRLLAVIVTGPPLARLIARLSRPAATDPAV